MTVKEFTKKDYEKFDKGMNFQEDKLKAIKLYNKKHKTNYKHISEFIHKLCGNDICCRVIGEHIDTVSDGILRTLKKMGVARRHPGGANGPLCNFTSKDLWFIRGSSLTQEELALKYHCCQSTICKIINRVERWAKI